jgi:hypothetical protein
VNAEELIVRNTFINAQVGDIVDMLGEEEEQGSSEDNTADTTKLCWADNGENDKSRLVAEESMLNPVE